MLRNQVLAAAEQALTAEPASLTVEALARLVSQRVGRQMPHRQVAEALRGKPERFLEGGDGRWRLRERPGVLTAEDVPDVSTGPAPSRPALRRGCYVVFDLEATGPSPESPETELLQIAARRYVDGAPGELWQTYAGGFVCQDGRWQVAPDDSRSRRLLREAVVRAAGGSAAGESEPTTTRTRLLDVATSVAGRCRAILSELRGTLGS